MNVLVHFDQVEARVRQLSAEGLQDKLTMPEIKVFLKAMGFLVGGKKAHLLDTLSFALEEEAQNEARNAS